MQLSFFEEELDLMHALCFTGHRPDKLGGYNMKNPMMQELKQHLLALIEQLIVEKDIRDFYSGGALGLDQGAFWCVEILKRKYPHIQNILAIPFENQYIKWSKEQIYWYQKMLQVADKVIDVARIPQYDSKETPDLPITDYSSKKMNKRNQFMVDHAHYVIAVYDGSKGGTSNCYHYAQKKNRVIYVLDPKDHFSLSVENNAFEH